MGTREKGKIMLAGLNHITIAAKDIEKSFDFYVNVLGFKPHVKWDKGAHLSLDKLWLCLSFDKSKKTKDYTHIAFSAKQKDFNTLIKKLTNLKIKEWKINTSEGDSIYILDPDGHKLEIHVGSLLSRLEYIKKNPYNNTVFY